MTLVVDASVIVKWLISDPEHEESTAQATQVMRSIAEGGELPDARWPLDGAPGLSPIVPPPKVATARKAG